MTTAVERDDQTRAAYRGSLTPVEFIGNFHTAADITAAKARAEHSAHLAEDAGEAVGMTATLGATALLAEGVAAGYSRRKRFGAWCRSVWQKAVGVFSAPESFESVEPDSSYPACHRLEDHLPALHAGNQLAEAAMQVTVELRPVPLPAAA